MKDVKIGRWKKKTVKVGLKVWDQNWPAVKGEIISVDENLVVVEFSNTKLLWTYLDDGSIEPEDVTPHWKYDRDNIRRLMPLLKVPTSIPRSESLMIEQRRAKTGTGRPRRT